MRRTVLALLIALAAPAGASAATPWVGFQPVSATEPAAGFGPFLSGIDVKLAVNSSGASVATWLGTGGRVLAARRPPAGVWSDPQVVSTAGATAGTGLDVAMDDAGDATVVWSTTDGTVSATTSLAGAAFSGQQTVTSGLSGFASASMDVAMNASGQAVAAFVAGDSAHPVFVSSSTTPGGAWATATTISGVSSGRSPAVAINAAGVGVATFLAVPSSGTVYQAMGSVKPATGTFPPSADLVLTAADPNTPPSPVIDKDGVIQVLVRTQNEPTVQTDKYAVFVIRRAPGNNFFYGPDPSGSDRPGRNCLFDSHGAAVTQIGGQLTVDSTGAVTAAFLCNSNLETISRPAGQLFTSPPTPTTVVTDVGGQAQYTFAGTPDGHQMVVANTGAGVIRAYRRASTAVPFSAGEAIVDPDAPLSVITVGIDDHADAVGLVSKANGMSAYDLSSTVLDLTPAAAAIAGPDTGTAGTPLTYTVTATDAFGGLVGTPSWTTSPDGGSGTGATFTHTFATAGTYQVGAGQKDLGGATAAATRTVVITGPAAGVTPTPTATVAPTVTATPTASPTVSPTPTPSVTPAVVCKVPKLKGKTVAKARKALKKAHCKLGKVKKPEHAAKKIKTQAVKKGTRLPAGAKVKVTLKKKH